MGNKTYDFSSKKKDSLPKNDQIWLIQYPVGGSVGGCGARAVSRKTPIYFIILFLSFRWMAHHLIEKFDNVVEGLIMVPVVGRCLW